jgi:hypothetical protein
MTCVCVAGAANGRASGVLRESWRRAAYARLDGALSWSDADRRGTVRCNPGHQQGTVRMDHTYNCELHRSRPNFLLKITLSRDNSAN